MPLDVMLNGGSSPRARGTRLASWWPWRVWRIIPACAGNTTPSAVCLMAPPDHPRVRGEHYGRRSNQLPVTGSSPRARGTPGGIRRASLPPRIIPACAGNTLRPLVRVVCWVDHPRVRGEHVTHCSVLPTGTGSSPRARGTLHSLSNVRLPTRIIPACAGNTRLRHPSRGRNADHPRVRGEHAAFVSLGEPHPGSSPRARGTRCGRNRSRSAHRIIPACAGNTFPKDGNHEPLPDHPRVRGEHAQRATDPVVVVGSSPRARGTPEPEREGRSRGRIIPACAGNTWCSPRWRWRRTDHPRVRGEHQRDPHLLAPAVGSSPRARGTRREPSARATRHRIIPACAGNTTQGHKGRPSPPDHPRVRGEHATTAGGRFAPRGSSPRARGTPGPRARRGDVSRIIPACAGNTRTGPHRTRPAADHPRVRGEHYSTISATRKPAGSSPRARGTPPQPPTRRS